jgi:hypothetical protein
MATKLNPVLGLRIRVKITTNRETARSATRYSSTEATNPFAAQGDPIMRLVLIHPGRWRSGGLAFGLVLLLAASARADAPKARAPLPTGRLDAAAWLKFSTAPLEAGEVDRLVSGELKQAGIQAAPLTTDEQFLRRAYLDLTGRLPMPADVTEFLADKALDKRARTIDKLLDSEEYAKHWAQYWRTVITSRTIDLRALVFARSFENWLAQQLQANKSWGAITRELLTASGALRYDEPDKNGHAYFVLSRIGNDAIIERTAETSRIFLGIQIQCAQCHDHPSDVWQRRQFHELAAYFARLRERPLREGKMMIGIQTVSAFFGEHQMPGKDDPKKGPVMDPRFLDGTSPGAKLGDEQRRKALAASITAKENPWFAAAFVNRMWGELMGQAFYQPIDDLGPQKEAIMPAVVARLAGSFRGSDYDIKMLLRALMNSDTYQRQIRPGEAAEDHLLFAASSPVRMNADSLWQALVGTLGRLDAGPRPGMGGPMGGPFARLQSFETLFKAEFGYDPSSRPAEVEGSVSQALLLMNNGLLNAKIQATGTNLLARVLASYSQDDEALRVLYLRTLARRPTDRETQRCRQHVARVGNRAEAFEDVLWALINSTEYQTKR